MGEGVRGLAHQITDIIHLLAAGAWLGALPVVACLLPYLHAPERALAAQMALIRFSTVGHGVVVVVILSGIANVLTIIGRLPLIWTSPYLHLLAVKVAIVAVMVMLAIVNRYVLVPRMRYSRLASNYFSRGVQAEIVLSIMAVLAVACFGMLDPN
jgi:putative copper resistance protein D